DDLWLVGESGAIAHHGATGWTTGPLLTGQYLPRVAALAPDDVFVIGGGGTVLHFDGTAWAAIRASTSKDLDWLVAAPTAFVTLSVEDTGTVLHRFERHGFWSCRDHETACTDGLDDDCDGAIDHADADCP